jgi:class 3 adenylate cyclase
MVLLPCGFEARGSSRDLGLEVRAGLHTGECEVIEGKWVGITVSIGARGAAQTQAVQSLSVSQTVKDLAAEDASPSRTLGSTG